ncbi:acyltransferase family protein [Arenimonas sp.]|uniref:acyltransferase family protein n=1 Tax=Arenimonas sp. TaxID=1872635 RepID=UPI002E30C979|nr:acyltransferase family protein [Arenimonas sp.]HEX4853454.1 acyltransferase family protein [Arenimonas sp.]
MSPLAYRREIDGLRAIAIVAVVVYHLDAAILPGGFAGVDVFFVLSGYLITLLLAREWQAKGRIDLPDFYARRVRRLLPALLLVVAAVLLLSVWRLGPLGAPFRPLTESALASVLFVANEYFLATAGDYFAGPTDQLPLLHLWSLAVEEQFYLVFPLLLGLLLARGLRAARAWLLVLSLASLLLAEHWLQFAPQQAFFRMPSRFWELAAGALVALSPAVARPSPRGVAWLATAGLTLVLVALAAGAWQDHFPGLGALLPVLGTAMVLRAVHVSPDLGWVGRGLSTAPMVWLGLWSYSLYLWHWPLLALDRATSPGPSSLAWRAGLCLLALGLAALTHRYVEQPIRRGWRAPPRRVLLAGGAFGTAVLVLALGLGRLDLVPPERRAMVERTRADRPQDMATCHYHATAIVVGPTPPACPTVDGARLVVWGDSHAFALRPFAEVFARARGTRVRPMTMDSCPPLAGPIPPHPRDPLRKPRCEARNRLALEAITAPGAYDTVVLGGLFSSHLSGPWDLAWLSSELDRTVSRLADVREVVLVASVPALRQPAPVCIAAGRVADCALPRDAFEARAEPLRRILRALSARHPNLRVVDPTAFFCGDVECPATRDGYALFWDDDHVSSTAARALGEDFLAHPSRYTLAPAPTHPPDPPGPGATE